MQYVGISTCQFIPCYAGAIHKHPHTRILKPFEDSEPTGLKVDTALSLPPSKVHPYCQGPPQHHPPPRSTPTPSTSKVHPNTIHLQGPPLHHPPPRSTPTPSTSKVHPHRPPPTPSTSKVHPTIHIQATRIPTPSTSKVHPYTIIHLQGPPLHHPHPRSTPTPSTSKVHPYTIHIDPYPYTIHIQGPPLHHPHPRSTPTPSTSTSTPTQDPSLPPATSRSTQRRRPAATQRSAGGLDVRSLVGYPPKETLHDRTAPEFRLQWRSAMAVPIQHAQGVSVCPVMPLGY